MFGICIAIIILQVKVHFTEKNALKTVERQTKIDQFNNVLAQIPKAKVTISNDPVKKKSISDLYSLPFNTIQKSTAFERLKDFTVVDVETTGLQTSDEIVAISAIKFRNAKPVEMFTTLLNSNKPISPEATKVNGITQKAITNKPYFFQIIKSLSEFIGKDTIVGHNLLFDLKYMYHSGYDFLKQNPKRNYYDTLELSKATFKHVLNYKLDTLAEFVGIQRSTTHRVASDCLATGYLFISIARNITREYF